MPAKYSRSLWRSTRWVCERELRQFPFRIGGVFYRCARSRACPTLPPRPYHACCFSIARSIEPIIRRDITSFTNVAHESRVLGATQSVPNDIYILSLLQGESDGSSMSPSKRKLCDMSPYVDLTTNYDDVAGSTPTAV